MNRLIDRYAVVFVAVAATLWATDAYFRNQLVADTFVLQQTQPLIAIALAWVVLGERRRPWFWPAAAVGIAGVYMVLFASDPFSPVAALRNGRLEVGLLALGAAALWASGTVLGRFALGSISFWSMTSLRFTLALPVLVVIVLVQSGLGGFGHYRLSDFVPNLLAIAIVPGLLALLLYYRALSKTPASLATIAEMAYPVAATLIASAPYPWGFHQPLYPAQLLGTAVLLGVIVFLNWTRAKAPVVIVRPLSVAEV